MIAAALALLAVVAASARPALWGDLPPGSHPVGLRVEYRADPDRPLDTGRPRPLEVGVWYPAAADAHGGAVTYGDYVALMDTELDSAAVPDTAAVVRFRADAMERGLDAATVDRWIAAPMAAIRNAAAARDTCPLVVVAAGNNNALHPQSLLCELLAAHGFVVLALPSQSRITAPPASLEDVLPSAEEQAADLDWLVTHAGALSPAPLSGVAAIGYSFGGRSVLVYAAKHPGLDAMVSLDGGMGNAMGKDFLAGAPWFDPLAITVPILHVYQSGDRFVQPDFDLIESLARSPRLLVEILHMRHGHFATVGMLSTLGPGTETLFLDGVDPRPGYELAATTILRFLRAKLRGDAAAAAELDSLATAPPASAPLGAVRFLPARED